MGNTSGETAVGRWASGLVASAGVMGFSGVVLAAASVHRGGGDLASTASQFLLVHAAAVIGLAAVAINGGSHPRLHLVAASLMALGAVVFSGDLAVLAFVGARPVPAAAPIGGFGMIAGWALVTVAALRTCFADPRRGGR